MNRTDMRKYFLFLSLLLPFTVQAQQGHSLQAMAGFGYSAMGVNQGETWQQKGTFRGNVQLRYLYYFTENWGVGIGVGGSHYTSTSIFDGKHVYVLPDGLPSPTKDSEGENYIPSYCVHDWTSTETAYMIDVPILVQCMYPIESVKLTQGPMRVYANAGFNLGFSVGAHRQLMSGTIDYIGWYRNWGLTLEHIDGHDFYTAPAEAFNTNRQALSLKQPAVGLMVDAGVALPVASVLDIMMGVYMNFTLNDVGDNSVYTPITQPWQVGLRLGLNFHTGK